MKRIIFAMSAVLVLATCKKENKNTNQPQPTGPVSTTPVTYTVKYYGNGNTSGLVPINTNSYSSGSKAVVVGNTGSLSRIGYTYMGWNSDSTGTGTDYCPGDSVTISNSNFKLYAKWVVGNINPASYNTTLNCGGSGWTNPACASSSSLILKSVNGLVEVTLAFYTTPTTGTYSVSTVAGPSNVGVTVLNAPGQPCDLMWYGKISTVTVSVNSSSITATFSGIQCVQAMYNFPVVSLSGSALCN